MPAVKQVRKCFSMQWHNCSRNSELGGGGSNVATTTRWHNCSRNSELGGGGNNVAILQPDYIHNLCCFSKSKINCL